MVIHGQWLADNRLPEIIVFEKAWTHNAANHLLSSETESLFVAQPAEHEV